MKIRKLAAVSALTIAALGVAGGTAVADPATTPAPPTPNSAPVAPSVSDAAKFMSFVAAQALNPSAPLGGPAPTLSTPIGSLSVGDGQLQASTASGQVVGSVPIAQVGQPQVNAVAARPVPVTPVLDYGWKTEGDREQWAFKRAQDSISTAAAISGAVGAVGGGAVGCVIGGIGATAATGPFAILGTPIAGCLLGAAAGATLGGLVTAAVVTIPVAVAAGIGYFQTVNSPFVAPKSSPQKVIVVPN